MLYSPRGESSEPFAEAAPSNARCLAATRRLSRAPPPDPTLLFPGCPTVSTPTPGGSSRRFRLHTSFEESTERVSTSGAGSKLLAMDIPPKDECFLPPAGARRNPASPGVLGRVGVPQARGRGVRMA